MPRPDWLYVATGIRPHPTMDGGLAMTRHATPLTNAPPAAAPPAPIPLHPRERRNDATSTGRDPRTTTEPHAPTARPATVRPMPSAVHDLFGPQLTSTAALPAPGPMLESLTRCVVEIIAGARDLDQIARWVSDDVYRGLLKRVVLGSRARQARGERPIRPAVTLGRPRIGEPADGVVEAVTVVHGRGRSRAVAIRLEGIDGRWRATAISVL